MNTLKSQCNNVQWFIGFLVSPETEDLLLELNKKIKAISDEYKLDFVDREQCFHATIDYFQWTQHDFKTRFEQILQEVQNIENDILNTYGVNKKSEFDETFHKLWLMTSYTNKKVYLCLFPHQDNPLINKIGKKWQAHISLGSFPVGSLEYVEKFLWQFKLFRDEILSDNYFALDFSHLYHRVK